MIDEMDYTVEKLDDWYLNRFKDKYTLELEREFKARVFRGVEEDPEFLETIEYALSRETQLRDAEVYFSREYTHLEDLLGEGIVPIGSAERLINFVKRVRKMSSDIFPEVLVDRDFEDCFKELFSSPRDFANAVIGGIDANRFELEGEYGTQTGQQSWNMNMYINSLREVIPYLMEKVFGDLYSN